MEKFRKLGITEHAIQTIQEQRFEEPTEIQEKTIPTILEGKDVIAGASTGSGKTLAFGTGIAHHCEHGKGIQALILTPTRELAEQVSVELRKFSKHKHLSVTSIYGGVSINPQFEDLGRADVVVGTPGRILDHIDRRTIRLEHVKILVLDEADRMLDMGFKEDVERIIRHCPKQRQTLLFSATISYEIAHLSKKYMNNPIEISAESYVDPTKLTQVYYDVADGIKFSALVYLLNNEKAKLVMVFCNTQRNTDFVANNLKALGIDAIAIHGGYSQDKRKRTMEQFNSQKFTVLVCTDVAARGLDIKGVSHIYNYDIPKDSKEYIHRIGRTARAGEEGKAISILAQRDYENFQRVLNNSEINIKKEELPRVERVPIRYLDNRTRGNNRESYGYRGGGGRDHRPSGGRNYGYRLGRHENRYSEARDDGRGRRDDGERGERTGNRYRNESRSSDYGRNRFRGHSRSRFSSRY